MDVRVSGIFEEFSDKIRRAFESDGLTGGCLLRGGHRAGVEIVEVGGRDVVASGRRVRSGYIRTNAVRDPRVFRARRSHSRARVRRSSTAAAAQY